MARGRPMTVQANGHRRCWRCLETKPLDEFYVRRDGPTGQTRYRGDCKNCVKARSHRYYESHPEYRQRSTRRWQKIPPERAREYAAARYNRSRSDLIAWVHMTFPTRRSAARKRGHAFTITAGDVIAAYIRQKGRCALTGRRLTWGGRGIERDTLSVDRIDNDAGYHAWNIRLVTYQANWARSKFSDIELYKFCRDLIAHFASETENGAR